MCRVKTFIMKGLIGFILCTATLTMAQNPRLLRDIATREDLGNLDILEAHYLDRDRTLFLARHQGGPPQFYVYQINRGFTKISSPNPALSDQTMAMDKRHWSPDTVLGFFFSMTDGFYYYSFSSQQHDIYMRTDHPDQIIRRDIFYYDPVTGLAQGMAFSYLSESFQFDPAHVTLIPGTRLILHQPRSDSMPGVEIVSYRRGEWKFDTFDEVFTPSQSMASDYNFCFYAPAAHEVHIYDREDMRFERSVPLNIDEHFIGFDYYPRLNNGSREVFLRIEKANGRQEVSRLVSDRFTPLFELPPGAEWDISYFWRDEDGLFGVLTDTHLEFQRYQDGEVFLETAIPRPAGIALESWNYQYWNGGLLFSYLFANGEGKILFLPDYQNPNGEQVELASTTTGEVIPHRLLANNLANSDQADFIDFQGQLQSYSFSQRTTHLLWQAPQGETVQGIETLFVQTLSNDSLYAISTNQAHVLYARRHDAPELYRVTRPQTGNGSSMMRHAYSDGDHWYFWARRAIDETYPDSFYVSDGTLAGTTRLWDGINSEGAYHHYAGTVFNQCQDEAGNDVILATDGSLAGTRVVLALNTVPNHDKGFMYRDWYVTRLRQTSGTSQETVLRFYSLINDQQFEIISDLRLEDVLIGDYLFFEGPNFINPPVYRVDFSAQALELIDGLDPVFTLNSPSKYRLYRGDLLEFRHDEIRRFDPELLQWQTPIAVSNTPLAYPVSRKVIDDQLYVLTQNPYRLWLYNDQKNQMEILVELATYEGELNTFWKTPQGWIFAERVDLNYAQDAYDLHTLSVDGESLLHFIRTATDEVWSTDSGIVFKRTNTAHGMELWHSDGSPSGTQVIDTLPGPASSHPESIVVSGSQVLFRGYHQDIGNEPTLFCAAPSTVFQTQQLACVANSFEIAVPPAGPSASYQWQITGGSIVQGATSHAIQVMPDGSPSIEINVTVNTPNGCQSQNQISIPVASSLPDTPQSIDGDSEFCPGSVLTFSVTSPAAPAYRWLLSDGGEIISGQGTDTIEVATTDAFQWVEVVAENGCGISESVRMTPSAVGALSAGEDQNLCGVTTAQLAASVNGSMTNAQWRVLSGTGGSFDDATDPNTLFHGQLNQIYVLEWAADTTCGSARDRVVVRLSSLNNITVTDSMRLCAPETITLEGTLPFGAIGEWRILQGENGTLGDANAATTTFNGRYDQSYVLEWFVESNDCGSASRTLTIDIAKFRQDETEAGTTQELYLGDPIQLAATKADTSEGMWRVAYAPPIANPQFADPTDPTTLFDPGPHAIGTFILEWTESFPGCFTASDRVEIIIRSNAEQTNEIYRSLNGSSVASGQAFTDAGVYFGQESFPNTHLYYLEVASGDVTDYGPVGQYMGQIVTLGDLLIIQGRPSFGSTQLYVFDTTTQILEAWDGASSGDEPVILANDQAVVVQLRSVGTFIIDTHARRTSLPNATALDGQLVGDQYYFIASDDDFTVKVFDVTTQTISTHLTFTPEETGGFRPTLIHMLNQRLHYRLTSGDSAGMLYSKQSTETEAVLLATDTHSSMKSTPSGVYFKGDFVGDQSGVGFYRTDGTLAGTQHMPWQGLTIDNLSGTTVHGEHLLDFANGNLSWLPADGQPVQKLAVGIGAQSFSARNSYFQLPNGEAMFVSSYRDTTISLGYGTNFVFHHIGRNPAQYYNFQIHVTQRSGHAYMGVSGDQILATLDIDDNGSSNQFKSIQTMPYAPFADNVALQTTGSTCPGSTFDIAVTDGAASDIEWHIEGAEFVAINERSIRVQSSPTQPAMIRARMRDASDQLENHMLRLGTATPVDYQTWGVEGSRVKITEFVQAINQCDTP